MNGNLIIYKASAGSGKTFTLAADYISLLLSEEENGNPPTFCNPQFEEAYRHILAVTFTNKATTEMKERILQHLYGIAHELDDSEKIFYAVSERLPGVKSEILRRRAKRALGNIVHDYDRFSVTTIDSFFQTLLANLAHELDLSANFHVDINDKEALRMAVERMVASAKYGSKEFKWIIQYIGDRIEKGEKWDITKEVEEFAKNLLRADYLQHEQELTKLLSDNKFVESYRSNLKQERSNALARIANPASQINAVVNSLPAGYETFSNGKVLKKFLKNAMEGEAVAANDTICKFADASENWYRKSDLKKGTDIGFVEPLREKLNYIINERANAMRTINSCDLSLRLLNPLRLLNEINKHLNEVNKENNRFLLARTPILFEKIVGADDAPFVFEKAGIRYDHIMIDEFQDTSLLQWSNFRKLFIENMASGGDCMLVGDVKQSIYRWRGGDWGILSNIEKDFGGSRLKMHTLDTNYRSEDNIIAFNNRIFPRFVEIFDLEEDNEKFRIGALYDDVAQKTAPEKPAGEGYVHLSIVDKNAEDCDAMMLDDMAAQILTLKELGVNFSDMAILVRQKSDGANIIDHFSQYHKDIPLVSDEAYMLGTSPSLQVIVQALKLLIDANNKIALGYLAHHLWAQKNKTPFNWTCSDEEKFALLPENFLKDVERLKEMPLYELCEKLIELFKLEKCAPQSTYIYSFLDNLQSYLEDNASNIAEFITHWEETLSSSSVQAGLVEGIRIITIHKSKGLAFHTVLLPYCDWSIDSGSGLKIIWCEPKEAPFNQLPLLPIPRTKETLESIYSEDYKEELKQIRIENLNMLYVAFTRPMKNLLVWARHKTPKNETKINNVGQLIFRAVGKEKEVSGAPIPSKTHSEKVTKNPLIYKSEKEDVPIKSLKFQTNFIQSNESKRFIEDDEEKNKQEIFRKRGTLLHDILSGIEHSNDIGNAFRRAQAQGLLGKESEQAEIRKIIENALCQPDAKEWFDGSWTVYNECTILPPSGEKIQRPDRVMMRGDEVIVIDYKFGEVRKQHKTQIKKYINLLREMGYGKVKGYIWYPLIPQIDEVL